VKARRTAFGALDGERPRCMPWRGFAQNVITSSFTVVKPTRLRAARH
jgi:hypothetical protein